jgi:hypothetical protein
VGSGRVSRVKFFSSNPASGWIDGRSVHAGGTGALARVGGFEQGGHLSRATSIPGRVGARHEEGPTPLPANDRASSTHSS